MERRVLGRGSDKRYCLRFSINGNVEANGTSGYFEWIRDVSSNLLSFTKTESGNWPLKTACRSLDDSLVVNLRVPSKNSVYDWMIQIQSNKSGRPPETIPDLRKVSGFNVGSTFHWQDTWWSSKFKVGTTHSTEGNMLGDSVPFKSSIRSDWNLSAFNLLIKSFHVFNWSLWGRDSTLHGTWFYWRLFSGTGWVCSCGLDLQKVTCFVVSSYQSRLRDVEVPALYTGAFNILERK